jgi:hypothetical protein
MGMCKACGKVYSVFDMEGSYCKDCIANQPQKVLEAKKQEQLKTSAKPKPHNMVQLGLGLAGSLFLIMGIFIPFVSAIGIDINLFHNGKGDGMIVGALALIAVALSIGKAYEWLWTIGGASLATIAYDLWSINHYYAGQKSLNREFTQDAELLRISDKLIDHAYSVQWGVGVLIVGSILLIMASFLKPQGANQ